MFGQSVVLLLLAAEIIIHAECSCGELGSSCSVRFGSCRGQQGVCKTHSGCLNRNNCAGGGSFDRKSFFDDCGCAPAPPPPPAPSASDAVVLTEAPSPPNPNPEEGSSTDASSPPVSTPAPTTNPRRRRASSMRRRRTASTAGGCGELGSVCHVERGCNGQKGICKTKNGCIDRDDCSSSFDKNAFFDDCVCTPPGGESVAGVTGTVFVLLATLMGIGIYVAIALKASRLLGIEIPNIVHIPLFLGAFYSFTSFCFSMLAGAGDDFFTGGSFTFIMMICGLGIVGAPFVLLKQYGMKKTLLLMIWGFCAMAGFFSFTLSVAISGVAVATLFSLMYVVIRCLRSSWDKDAAENGDLEEACPGDHAAEARELAKNSALALIASFGRQGVAFIMRVINFVMQAMLISYAIGDVRGLRKEVRTYFVWSFDLSMSVPELTWCQWLVEPASQAATVMGDAAEQLSQFLVDYTLIWTPNKVVAYTSVGVFEVFVVAAVFALVLSDILLILAPRESSGCLSKLVVDFISRVVLYVLQSLASASNTLLLVLLFIQPIERPELSDSQKFFNETTVAVGVPVTLFYVGITLMVAAYLLCNLWSGSDAGLQNIAPHLLKMQGISVRDLEAGHSSFCAFLLAFFGIWPQHVLDAFEVEQRARNFNMDKQDVRLTTVNALSFPLYVLPFGGVVAKLGEYMNQCAVYVAGQGFLWANVCLSTTYALEYVLVLVVCSDALTSAEQGLADSVAEAEAKSNGSMLLFVLSSLLALALIRLVVAMASGNSCCRPSQTSASRTVAENNVVEAKPYAVGKNDDNDVETNSNASKASELTDSGSQRSNATVVVAPTNCQLGVIPGQALA